MTDTDSVLRPDFSEMLKLSEFAATLGVCTRTARRWIDKGDIKAVQTKGGHWRVPADQLATRALTTTQFAHLVGVHPVTVRRWISADLIAHTTTSTGRYRIPMTEVPRAGKHGVNR